MPTRLIVLGSFVVGLFSIILMRAYYLQVVEGDFYASVSQSNAVQERVLRPPRGILLDTKGRILASNRPSFDITFLPKGVPRNHYENVANYVATLTGQSKEDLVRLMEDGRRRPFNSVLLSADVSKRAIIAISENRAELPGILIEDRVIRNYPFGAAAAHLLGYIGEASPREIESDPSYIRGDWVGRAGIELALEKELAGKKGYDDLEVDALGQVIRKLSTKPSEAGSVVTMTIDADLQLWAHQAFSGKRGSFVAIEPSTGKIRALYSAPAYDPNIFVDRRRSAERGALFKDTGLPLFNRALQSTYSPGSTFKTVTMIAGLLSGKLTKNTRITCSGSHAGMKCWKDGGHGTLDLLNAYQNSCNVYFYIAGERIWIEPIYQVASALGLDQLPGFDLGPEEHGVVPTPEWERAHVNSPDGQHWGTGDVRNTAIGQGYVSVSPAQMARVVASAVAGGIRMHASVTERIENAQGTVTEFSPLVESDLHLSPEDRAFIREAMVAVVTGGTGRRAQIAGLTVGGKSGTAQTPLGLDHAWFMCAAPMENPKLAICVMVEHAGMGGGMAAAPIAKEVLEKYAIREGWIDTPAVVVVAPKAAL